MSLGTFVALLLHHIFKRCEWFLCATEDFRSMSLLWLRVKLSNKSNDLNGSSSVAFATKKKCILPKKCINRLEWKKKQAKYRDHFWIIRWHYKWWTVSVFFSLHSDSLSKFTAPWLIYLYDGWFLEHSSPRVILLFINLNRCWFSVSFQMPH